MVKAEYHKAGKYEVICKACGTVKVYKYHCHAKARVYCSMKCATNFRAETVGVPNQFGISKVWEPWEDVILEVLWSEGKSKEELAERFQTTSNSIVTRVAKLELTRLPEVMKELRSRGGRKNKGNKRPDFVKNRYANVKGEGNPFYGKTHTEKTRKVISESQKKKSAFIKLNDDPEFQKLRMAGLRVRPNKPETMLGEILEELYPGVYKYTGDGSSPVGRLSPDFTDATGKRIIEMFGETYHDPVRSVRPLTANQTEEGRTETLAKFGYRLLVVWSKELFYGGEEQRARLKDKIRRFHESWRD